MRKHRCPGGEKVARFPGMSVVSGSIPVSGLSFVLIFVVLFRHVRGLGFDSRVRTLFSIDLSCTYLVFTMLFIFVKRMFKRGAPCLTIP